MNEQRGETRERPRVAQSEIPDEPDLNLVPMLLSISKSSRALTAIAVAEVGLSVGQDVLLDALDQIELISVSNVSKAIDVRPSTVSKMVDRLYAKGFVERVSNGCDARRTMLRLTGAGVAKRKEVRAVWKRLERSLLQTDPVLGDDEVRTALIAAAVALRKRLARLR